MHALHRHRYRLFLPSFGYDCDHHPSGPEITLHGRTSSLQAPHVAATLVRPSQEPSQC